MTTNNNKKINFSTRIKKSIPYLLLLILLVVLLGPTGNAQAQQTGPQPPECTGVNTPTGCIVMGTCIILHHVVETDITGVTTDTGRIEYGGGTPRRISETQCTATLAALPNPSYWDKTWKAETLAGSQQTIADFENSSGLGYYLSTHECGLWGIGGGTFYPGCFVQATYAIFYVIPSWMLWLAAQFFNVLISITLYSTLFTKSTFIPQAWALVRDLSNIFFILILLYIAVKIILGIGGHEVKKMIAKVVIVALLVNFSMFFTEIVIDSSNIIALIFYNKMTVVTKNPDKTERKYDTISGEKDVAGGMVNAFDPTRLLSKKFFDEAGTQKGPTGAPVPGPVGPGIFLGIMLVAGLLMFYAAYCFFLGGLTFVGRLIELWALIIFSPFAFMSSTTPALEKIDYLGWESWLKRLVTVSFMAPIFMFFLYFIFLVVSVSPFKDIITDNGGSINTILLVVIPALVILVLLHKALGFAKKGSGVVGEALVKGGEVALGLAAGVTLGAGAKAIQGTVGQASSRLANSERLKKWEAEGKFGAATIGKVAKFGATSSFDLRKGVAGSALAAISGATGVNLGHATKVFSETGGFEADRKRKVAARQERMKELELGEDSKQKQDVRTAEIELHEVTNGDMVNTSGETVNRQKELVKLENGANAKDSKIADDNLATANTALGNDQNIQNLTAAQANLTAAIAGVTANPTDPAAQAALVTAQAELATAEAALDASRALVSNLKTAKENEVSAQIALAEDPTNTVAQGNLAAAQTQLATARTAVAADPTAQLIADQEKASATQLATKGMATLESDVAKAERAFSNAERVERDAVNNLATVQRSTAAAQAQLAAATTVATANPTDQAAQAALATAQTQLAATKADEATAEVALANARRDKEAIRVGGMLSNGKIVDKRDSREETIEILKTRKKDIKTTKIPIFDAENKLKLAQNAVIGINNQRREAYAHYMKTGILPMLDFLNAGMGKARTEASNKIRAGIQEEKHVKSDH